MLISIYRIKYDLK